jgi:anti-sigma regulatory factor (Ser/Thr protein kinase)
MTPRAVFEGSVDSIAAARAFAAGALAGTPPIVIDRVVLMVSELATNAVRHAGTGFEVSIQQASALLRIEVTDQDGRRPTQRHPQPADLSGRGLLIVEKLSTAWGVEMRGRSKTVWFSIDAAG